jgi:hypothetical protein
MNFEQLVQSIKTVHESMKEQAGKAVNVRLTLRNRPVGYYVSKYEMNGADRFVTSHLSSHRMTG